MWFDKIASYGADLIKWVLKFKKGGSVICHYLTTNELIYDQMNTLHNSTYHLP